MGLEFNHEQGAKPVMKHLYNNGVWAIFSTLDPRVLQFKPGLLMTQADCFRGVFQKLILLPIFFPQAVLGLALLLWFNALGIIPTWKTAVVAHLVWISPIATLIIAWEGYNSDDVLGPFRKANSGAKVRAESGTSDPDMINKLRAGEVNVWDLINVNQPWARAQLYPEGLIKPLNKDRFMGLAHKLGNAEPRVALLAASESVSEAMPVTQECEQIANHFSTSELSAGEAVCGELVELFQQALSPNPDPLISATKPSARLRSPLPSATMVTFPPAPWAFPQASMTQASFTERQIISSTLPLPEGPTIVRNSPSSISRLRCSAR